MTRRPPREYTKAMFTQDDVILFGLLAVALAGGIAGVLGLLGVV